MIEDNNVTQRVLQTMIEHQGHTTTILDMAEDALNYIQMGEKFDLILCDIQLNGMNGLDFTRKVRSMGTEFSDTVPILALSGSVEDEDIQACADAGMSGHLAKPIDPEIFDQILRDIAAMVYALPPETPATTAALNPSSLAGPAEEQAAPGPLPLTSDELEIDLLMTLRDSLGDRQLHQLLDSLYTKTEEIIAALAGQHTIDIEFTRARAHEMKGMCANFGLAKLSAQAKDIEFAAKEARIDDVATLIATLTPLYQKGRFDIENWLKH